HVKQARNTFVHEGTARIGDKLVDSARAGGLIDNATKIIAKIREWLPEEVRWPVHEHQFKIAIFKSLGALAGPTEQTPDTPATAEPTGGDTARNQGGNNPPQRDAS